MLREPYITANGIKGMKGMAEHLGEDLESFKARQGFRPKGPPKENNPHKLDIVGSTIGGMSGEIVDGLVAYSLEQAGKDPALTKALKDLLMIARLSAPDDFMEPYQTMMTKRLQRQKDMQEDYERRVADWEESQRRTIENYYQTESELKKRWERVLKSLRAAVKKDPDIRTMALVDQAVFEYLNKKGYVTIRNHIILDVDTRLDGASNGLVREIITKMNLIEAELTVDRWQQGALAILNSKKPKVRIGPPEAA